MYLFWAESDQSGLVERRSLEDSELINDKNLKTIDLRC